jgi:hypothetical protein
MAYKVVFVGAQAHEQTPNVAVYSLDSLGRVTEKIAVASEGTLDLSRVKAAVIALAPDVATIADLDPENLVTLRLADQLPVWKQTGAIEIPSQWWRGWLPFSICLSGTASRCILFWGGLEGLRPIALGLQELHFPEICEPLCNAVVEVWEYTTCCWPFLIPYVPPLIDNLAAFLTDNPIMFPAPPLPNPGPLDSNLVTKVDAAFAAGKVSNAFVPSTTLATHLATLRTLSPQDAVTYIETYPILWPFWCTGGSALLGQTAVNPDGTFSFCYSYFPLFRFNCRNSYFYKIKQLINGVWTYIYDGSAAQQYFSADETANLYTLAGQTCFQPPALGTDYIAFQAIGNTNTYDLNSNWLGATTSVPVGVDLTQVGDTQLAPFTGTPGQDAGLWVGSGPGYGGPWATSLNLLLNYDPSLQSASPSPYYYRFSIVQADATGAPRAGLTPTPLMAPVSWQYFDLSTSPPTTPSQSLGPVTVNGNQGLFQIPYFGEGNPSWLGNQFHQVLDTTTLPNVIPGGPGTGNGQFLLIVEVFDKSGNRLVPTDATSPLSTDTKGTFNYLRLITSATNAYVQFNSLTHVLWVDNRPVMGKIDYYMNPTGTQTCQFYRGSADTLFYVGFQAYHTVMCDGLNFGSPVPSASFMSSFGLSWEEGLNGPTGSLAQGEDTNWTNGCVVGVANAYSTQSPPSSSAFTVTPTTFSDMLGTETSCSFALTLGVSPKHTNGYGILAQFENISTTAVALSDAPPPPPCPPCSPIRLDNAETKTL